MSRTEPGGRKATASQQRSQRSIRPPFPAPLHSTRLLLRRGSSRLAAAVFLAALACLFFLDFNLRVPTAVAAGSVFPEAEPHDNTEAVFALDDDARRGSADDLSGQESSASTSQATSRRSTDPTSTKRVSAVQRRVGARRISVLGTVLGGVLAVLYFAKFFKRGKTRSEAPQPESAR